MTTQTYATVAEPTQYDVIQPTALRYPFSFKLDHSWTIAKEGQPAVPSRCIRSNCAVCGSSKHGR